LHHLDCPWRPADLEQREGRILRQFNQNPEVSIYSYVTERTYDAVIWQHIVRKTSFAQAMRQHTNGREVATDPDGFAVSAALAQAIATGDPRVMRRAELTEQVAKLQAGAAAHTAGKQALRRAAVRHTATATQAHNDLTAIRAAADIIAANPTPAYTPPDAQTPLSDNVAMGRALAQQINRALTATSRSVHDVTPLGTWWQLALTLTTYGSRPAVMLAGSPHLIVAFDTVKAIPDPHQASPAQLAGLAQRVTNAARRALKVRDQLEAVITTSQAALRDAQASLEDAGPYPHQVELDTKRRELEDIEDQLQTRETQPDADTTTQRLTPEETNGIVPRQAGYTDPLRPGDIIRAKPRTWEKHGAPKTLVEVVSVADGEPLIIKPVGAADTDAYRAPRVDTWLIVSRLRQALTPVETAALSPGWRLAGPWRWPAVGQTICVVDPAAPDQIIQGQLLRVETRNPTESEWATKPPDRVSIYSSYSIESDERWTIEADGVTKAVVLPQRTTSYPWAHYDPDDQRTPTRDGWIEAPNIPVGHFVIESDHDDDIPPGSYRKNRNTIIHPDGRVTNHGMNHVQVTTRVGPLMTNADLNVLWPSDDQPRMVTLGQTRPGDIISAGAADPKSVGINESVRIAHSPGYNGRGTIGYQFLQDPTATTHTVTRDLTVETPLLGRAYTSLTPSELRILACPQAIATNAAALIDAEPGTAFWVDCHTEPNGFTGYLIQAATTDNKLQVRVRFRDPTEAISTGGTVSPSTSVIIYPPGTDLPDHPITAASLPTVRDNLNLPITQPEPLPTCEPPSHTPTAGI
jgi:hypothetical protein